MSITPAEGRQSAISGSWRLAAAARRVTKRLHTPSVSPSRSIRSIQTPSDAIQRPQTLDPALEPTPNWDLIAQPDPGIEFDQRIFWLPPPPEIVAPLPHLSGPAAGSRNLVPKSRKLDQRRHLFASCPQQMQCKRQDVHQQLAREHLQGLVDSLLRLFDSKRDLTAIHDLRLRLAIDPLTSILITITALYSRSSSSFMGLLYADYADLVLPRNDAELLGRASSG